MKRQWVFLVSLCLCAALLLSCTAKTAPSASESGAESASSGEAQTVTFTDDLGREVTAPYQPRSTAALIGSFASVWTLAGGELTATADDAWTQFDLGLSEDVVNLGQTTRVSLEKLFDVDPDFVIASVNTQIDLDWKDTLEAAGIPVAYFDVNTFSEYLRMLDICTQVTGRRDLYTANGLDVQRQVDAAIARANGEGPRVLYLRATAASVKAKSSRRNVLGEMLNDLGCVNIADEDSDLLEDLSLERIVQADPDYIFVVKQGADTASVEKNLNQLLLENPAWSGLAAVREERVYYMDQKLYNLKPNNRWGEAYEQLADILFEKE